MLFTKKPDKNKTLHYMFSMKTNPGMHQLSARDDGCKMLLAAHNLVSHLCHVLFLLLECNKTQAVSVSLAGFELMY